MPLLENDKHKREHTLGPAELFWGKAKGLFKKKEVVMHYSMTRSTIDNEQVSCQVPVFADDTRKSLEDRLGMAYSIIQDRLDDAAEAWKISAEQAEAERLAEEEAGKKKK